MPHDAAVPTPMLGEKHRLRFAKRGDLRLLSHLDLMRSTERLCRRAQLPLKFSQGFHPAPRIVFALSLPLGVGGINEVLEIETTESLETDDVLRRLNDHAPAGLQFLSAKPVDTKTQAVPRRAIYRLELSETTDELTATIIALRSAERVWASRLKPRPRQVNIRPYLRNLQIDADGLTLDFWVTPYGTARADEVIALLGLPSPFESGATLERIGLEIRDEAPPDAGDAPPDDPPELKPLDIPAETLSAGREPAMATWGLSPHGPVVE